MLTQYYLLVIWLLRGKKSFKKLVLVPHAEAVCCIEDASVCGNGRHAVAFPLRMRKSDVDWPRCARRVSVHRQPHLCFSNYRSIGTRLGSTLLEWFRFKTNESWPVEAIRRSLLNLVQRERRWRLLWANWIRRRLLVSKHSAIDCSYLKKFLLFVHYILKFAFEIDT